MKKVLVTGSEGYIGKHLCKMIRKIRPDIELYQLDKDIHKTSSFKKRIDIIHRRTLGSKFKNVKFDTVIHLAALVQVGESVKIPTMYYTTNVSGTLNVLEQLEYDNFVFASTGAAANPNSPYGYSKRIAEDIVKEKCSKFTSFRFYNVTGTDGFPATNPDGLFYNLNKSIETGYFNLYGTDYNTKDGTCVREYIHVNDICASLIKSIDEPSNSIQNLAYGDTRTVREIIDIFKKVNDVNFKVNELPRREGDIEAMCLENPSKYMIQQYSYEEMLKL